MALLARARRRRVALAAGLAAVLPSCVQFGHRRTDPDWWESRTATQSLIGIARWNDDVNVELVSQSDPGRDAEANLTTMPLVGLAGQLPLAGRRVDVGFEAGILMGYRVDRTRTRDDVGGTVVEVAAELFLTDFFAGAFLSKRFGHAARIYVGAGPVVMYGRYSAELEDGIDETDETDESLGVGGYARAGLEFRLQDGGLLGFGARLVAVDLDFNEAFGDVALEGVQGFITYTVGF